MPTRTIVQNRIHRLHARSAFPGYLLLGVGLFVMILMIAMMLVRYQQSDEPFTPSYMDLSSR